MLGAQVRFLVRELPEALGHDQIQNTKRGLERSGNLPRVAELMSGGAGISSQSLGLFPSASQSAPSRLVLALVRAKGSVLRMSAAEIQASLRTILICLVILRAVICRIPHV